MSLDAINVSLIRSGRRLVSDASLGLGAGELVGLIGPNGAGKSTLLSILAGLNMPDEGYVNLNGQRLNSLGAKKRSQSIAWVEQSGPLNWPLSVERVITLGRFPHLSARQKLNHVDRQVIEQAIKSTDCEALRNQDATTLSGGERTRMMLARALASEPEILLADEPVAALDLGHQLQTMEVLKKFSEGPRSCLVVLHDLSLAARFCDRLYMMNQGCIHASGSPGHVLSKDNLESVYGVEVHIEDGDYPTLVPIRRI